MTATLTPTRQLDGRSLPTPGSYHLDPSHTEVGFKVRHLMVSKIRGRFADVSGIVTIADDPLESSVEATIGVASLDTRDEGRDEHLRSADFFDVENHATITFRSTGVTHAGGEHYAVAGDLTIRGVTQPVTLDAKFEGGLVDPWGNPRIGFSATAEVDRDDFDVNWNQALEAGGVLVGKTVTIEIEAEAVSQS